MSDATDILIEVRDLALGYGTRVVLEGLNFDVHRGEVFVILGGSGSGKSSLIRRMMGLDPPISGEILIEGQSIVNADANTRLELSREFGVLFQAGALFGSLTLEQNVMLPLQEHTTLSRELCRLLAREKLRAVGLDGFEHYLPGSCSGGMKKRAGLARAMALDPPLLFLDEPSAGLDPVSSVGLDRLILDLRDRFGTTMVVVSHELDSIYTIVDRLIMVKDKGIAAQGTLEEAVASAKDPYIIEFFTRGGSKDPLAHRRHG
jgi:phospholipid/cholesterol/gamma-HCH transport system ATP-binding protein